MTGSDVAAHESGSVPALNNTPAIEINSTDDIAVPQVKLGQYMSEFVQNGDAPAGSIFTITGSDDPAPNILWEQGADDKPVFYVLGMRKGKSVSDGGELELFDFNDPAAPPSAWVTYKYTIAIPAIDDELPFTILLTRTGKAAAQQINTVLAKNATTGPAWQTAFSIDCVERKNNKGKFFVPRIRVVDTDKDAVGVAANLAGLVASPAPEQTVSTEAEPAI